MYKFNTNMDNNDYLDFNIYHFIYDKAGRRTGNFTFFRLFPPLFWFLCTFLAIRVTQDFSTIIFLVVFCVAFTIFWLVIAKRRYIAHLRKNIKKMEKNGKLPYAKNVTMIFEQDTITQITEFENSTMKYSMMERIVETEKAIFIYVGANQAIIVPLSVFDDDNIKEQFIRFIEGKIQK